MTRAELIALIRWGMDNDAGGPLAVALGFAAVPLFSLLAWSFQ